MGCCWSDELLEATFACTQQEQSCLAPDDPLSLIGLIHCKDNVNKCRADYAEGVDRCQHCNRRAVNNLIIVNSECEICLGRANQQHVSIHRPLFGDFNCQCGRKWKSRRSWSDQYQICKRCRTRVFPTNQRVLRAGDMSRDRENVQDHPKELCQMCIELGYYCGKLKSVGIAHG